MNEVQPERNAASDPNAWRRYTYSPPARGRNAASSAYAIAPANARAPPANQVARNHNGCGTTAATCGGVNRMPPPITLDTMIAAASTGPSRRSSDELTRGEASDGGGGAAGGGARFVGPLRMAESYVARSGASPGPSIFEGLAPDLCRLHGHVDARE